MLDVSDTIVDRLPPHSLDAERAALGSAMLDADMLREVRSILSRDDFYLADNQIVFDALCALQDGGKPVDAITIREELRRRQLLEEIGGTAYIGELLGSVPSAAHGAHYAGIVREKAAMRRLIALANETLRRAYMPTMQSQQASEITQWLGAQISAIYERASGAKIEAFGDLLQRAYEEIGDGGGPIIATGFPALDQQIGGIRSGEIVIVAARPSMGKSTMCRQMAYQMAEHRPVGFISLEESPVKIARNLLSAESGIENQRLRNGQLHEQDWSELTEAVARGANRQLFVYDRARSLPDICAAASLMRIKHKIEVLFIDHLSKVRVPGVREQYQVVTAAIGGIADLIKDLNVAGVVVAQLNRGTEHRDDKRPTMSDLRDSGAVEQDADGILFLHRDDYYHLDDQNWTPTGKAEVIIAKWRDGARGKVVNLKSELRYQRFGEWTWADGVRSDPTPFD